MDRLKNKIALITGATSGIGAASAELFAAEGATVIVVGRNEESGKTVVENICVKYGDGRAVFVSCDVTKKDDIKALQRYVIDKYQCLDILFNNAGVLLTGGLEDISDEDWDASYDVNVKAVMHVCKEFMGILQKSHGVVLINASNVGMQEYITGRKSYMYASSKAACIQFMKHLARNYAPEVRVNAICPGVTETNIFTNKDFSRFQDCNLLGRIAHPEEIAKVALFLVSEDSSYITGATVVADGGEMIK